MKHPEKLKLDEQLISMTGGGYFFPTDEEKIEKQIQKLEKEKTDTERSIIFNNKITDLEALKMPKEERISEIDKEIKQEEDRLTQYEKQLGNKNILAKLVDQVKFTEPQTIDNPQMIKIMKDEISKMKTNLLHLNREKLQLKTEIATLDNQINLFQKALTDLKGGINIRRFYFKKKAVPKALKAIQDEKLERIRSYNEYQNATNSFEETTSKNQFEKLERRLKENMFDTEKKQKLLNQYLESPQQDCTKIISVPNGIGTCWFNALLVILFYSQSMRNMMIAKAKKWNVSPNDTSIAAKAKNRFFEIILDILFSMHHTDIESTKKDVKQKYSEISPDNISDLLYKIDPVKFPLNEAEHQAHKHNSSFFIEKILMLLGVTYMTLISVPNQGRRGHTLYIKPYVIINQFDMSYYSPKQLMIYNDVLLNGVDLVIIDNMMYFDSMFMKKNIGISEGLVLSNGVRSYNVDLQQNLIDMGNHEYVKDAAFFINHDKEPKCTELHEMAGITCDNKSYMYNGWIKEKTGVRIGEENLLSRNVYPCEIQKFNWKSNFDKDFCIDRNKCNIFVPGVRMPQNNQKCFDIKGGTRLLFFVNSKYALDYVDEDEDTNNIANVINSSSKKRQEMRREDSIYKNVKRRLSGKTLDSANDIGYSFRVDAIKKINYTDTVLSCIRQVSNWSKLDAKYKFDDKRFDPKALIKDLPTVSPKMKLLLDTIERLDNEDLRKHNHTFKHFIFSGVRQGYGAKIVASALIASGKELVYNEKLKMKDGRGNSGADRFALLTGSTVYGDNISINLRNQILKTHNERPGNVHGQKMRFIVLDSDFKEGIDLWDVRYVHIFEPQTNKADKDQIIGRATRFCGQAGLTFNTKYGWPLYVKIYDTAIPGMMMDSLDANTLHELYFKNSKIDFKLQNFNDDILKYTIMGSVDYPLNHKLHTHFKKEQDKENVFPEDGMKYFSFLSQKGGKSGELINDDEIVINCKGECSHTHLTNDVPVSNAHILLAFLAKDNIEINERLKQKVSGKSKTEKKEEYRKYFCKIMKDNNDFCGMVKESFKNVDKFYKNNKLNIDKNFAKQTQMIQSLSSKWTSLDMVLEEARSRSELIKQRISQSVGVTHKKENSKGREKNQRWDNVKKREVDAIERERRRVKYVQSLPFELTKPFSQYKSPHRFINVRNFVVDNFSKFKWTDLELKNICVNEPEEKNSSQMTQEERALEKLRLEDEELYRRVTDRRILKFTPTQDFIRHYFHPDMDLKGMLIYHTVGTGKCHAYNTPIMMASGEIKMVQNIEVGEEIMGDDFTPRIVYSLAQGTDEMYEIQQENAMNYTVNQEHIMCLKIHDESVRPLLSSFVKEDGVVEIEVKDLLAMPKRVLEGVTGYKAVSAVSTDGLVDGSREIYHISTPFKIIPKGRGTYYGFTLNKNRRYLLGDQTVTHNTCSAIATITTNFEPRGYTILWVTRSSLKADIWKNLFTDICHEKIRQEIKEGTLDELPEGSNYEETVAKRKKKLLSESWSIEPISYKQFSNLLSGQNKYQDILVKKNGKTDPLRKTLIVIDEAHKLYGESVEMRAAEIPDMDVMYKHIMKSYEISKKDSVRLLLMTGTPFTQNAMELIKLINLLKPEREAFPSEYSLFSDAYLDKTGRFYPETIRKFLNKIAGHVSYLNREPDARAFAQPQIENVTADMSLAKIRETIGVGQGSIESLMVTDEYFKAQISKRKKEIAQLDDQMNMLNPFVPEQKLQMEKLELMMQSLREKFKRENQQYLQNKRTIENLKENIKKLKKEEDFSQENILFSRCFGKDKGKTSDANVDE